MDEEVIPDQRPAVQVTQQNVGGGLLAGMPLWAKVLATMGLTGFVSAVAWFLLSSQTALLKEALKDARDDRVIQQQLFRESVRDIQRDADRRAGEVKGALDANTAVMRQLIDELQKARRAGMIRSDSAPRPAGPNP